MEGPHQCGLVRLADEIAKVVPHCAVEAVFGAVRVLAPDSAWGVRSALGVFVFRVEQELSVVAEVT